MKFQTLTFIVAKLPKKLLKLLKSSLNL